MGAGLCTQACGRRRRLRPGDGRRIDARAQIEQAFADAPRPSDDDLLAPDCFDDNDIAALYGVAHWRDLDDAAVEREYAALSFLSAGGLRHFLPAYMLYVLRHGDTGAAVVDSTVWAFRPVYQRGRLAALDDAQRAAVDAFLAEADHPEAAEIAAVWRSGGG